jgi:hypothetical protein
LEHGIASNDNRLNDITVKGDEVFVTDGIQTRSQTQNQSPQWTNIPLLVKIYKLLVNELSNQIEANMALEEEEEEVRERSYSCIYQCCCLQYFRGRPNVLAKILCLTYAQMNLMLCGAYEIIVIFSFEVSFKGMNFLTLLFVFQYIHAIRDPKCKVM